MVYYILFCISRYAKCVQMPAVKTASPNSQWLNFLLLHIQIQPVATCGWRSFIAISRILRSIFFIVCYPPTLQKMGRGSEFYQMRLFQGKRKAQLSPYSKAEISKFANKPTFRLFDKIVYWRSWKNYEKTSFELPFFNEQGAKKTRLRELSILL